MRTGVVISLAVGARGNKILKKGDKVTERSFPHGNFQKLVNSKHIEETFLGEPAKEDFSFKIPEETNEPIDINSVSKKQIIKDLTDRNIEFDKTADKETLFQLWLKK